MASQLKILIRPMYSNPPLYGARVVHAVRSDDARKAPRGGLSNKKMGKSAIAKKKEGKNIGGGRHVRQ